MLNQNFIELNGRFQGMLKNNLVNKPTTKKLKELVISDTHLVHRRTPTTHIVNNIKSYVLNEANTDVDVIYIAGDLFDRSFDVGNEEYLVVLDFLKYLLDYCHEFNIMLRVLEGTPSHDWKQPRTLIELNNIRETPIDLKYYNVLDIEYNEKLDRYVLYIPDEYTNDHAVIEKEVAERMREHGITQVDTAILHGQTLHQIAGIPNFKPLAYDENYLMSVVKGFTHIGHVHRQSLYQRVSAQGSFDRLAHGEEEDKGYVIVEDGVRTFIKNPNAFIYKTLKLTKNDNLQTLDKKINNYPKGSHIRLNLAKDHPLNNDFRNLKIRYMDYHVERLTESSESDSLAHILTDSDFKLDDFNTLTGDIKSTLRERVLTKHQLTEEEVQLLDSHLEMFNGSQNQDELED